MTKSNSNKIVELYPEMFIFSVRGYEHNIFEKAYNKVLGVAHKHFKFTRSINYIQQTPISILKESLSLVLCFDSFAVRSIQSSCTLLELK
jgi:hypothetical protein